MIYIRLSLISLLFLFASNANAECPTQIQCLNGVCERVSIPNCNAPNQAKVFPSSSRDATDVLQDKSQNSPPILLQDGLQTQNVPIQNLPNQNVPIQNLYSAPCAENGSCYGDISSITGLPKTTHVNGYYRKDGTHVRGYYRSHR